jgi:hypothetical protein
MFRIQWLMNSAHCSTHEKRLPVHADEPREDLDHPLGRDRSSDVDGQAVAPVLVDHGKTCDLPALGRVLNAKSQPLTMGALKGAITLGRQNATDETGRVGLDTNPSSLTGGIAVSAT